MDKVKRNMTGPCETKAFTLLLILKMAHMVYILIVRGLTPHLTKYWKEEHFEKPWKRFDGIIS